MSNTALTTIDEQRQLEVLQSSLFPGAKPASIALALDYCRAAGYDPMQKPVHIVPMWDGKAQSMRDVIMPGIGIYRTNAARTGALVGISEPEFGPMVTENLGGLEVTFPEWCKVTVKRYVAGLVAEFTAVEYWLENYATKGGKERSEAPNAMWMKRKRGQIAKCAEAQALRKAFPEAVPSVPVAEEMEGKTIDADVIEHDAEPRVHKKVAALRDAIRPKPEPEPEPITLAEVVALIEGAPDLEALAVIAEEFVGRIEDPADRKTAIKAGKARSAALKEPAPERPVPQDEPVGDE